MIGPTTHWRDSARTPRFFGISAYAVFPFLVLLIHARLNTLIFALLSATFFTVLERFGFTVPIFFRWLRSTLCGPRRLARHWWRAL